MLMYILATLHDLQFLARLCMYVRIYCTYLILFYIYVIIFFYICRSGWHQSFLSIKIAHVTYILHVYMEFQYVQYILYA